MFALYAHSGSGNHGCEALARSTCKIFSPLQCVLYSPSLEQENTYQLDQICTVHRVSIRRWTFSWFVLSVLARLHLISRGIKLYYFVYRTKCPVCLSIGGDNYCCPGFPEPLAYANRRLNRQGKKTVLWGCSIEPELLENPKILQDLNRYALITARESITYNALLKAGVSKNTKLYPDPAFALDTVKLPLPPGFEDGNTVGINVSPLIMEYEKNQNAVLENYQRLVEYILKSTGMRIALIPHVVWAGNDDRVPLRVLYDEFRDSGRVVMIEDHNCMELKGYISRCRMLVCARTHASIAAYSTCVPTLVVGYSVKAKGIAKDILGTYEHFVVPVQSLRNDSDLVIAFRWLMKHENEIRQHLQNFIPGYCAKAWEAGNEIRKLIEEDI
mgnify:FL=1